MDNSLILIVGALLLFGVKRGGAGTKESKGDSLIRRVCEIPPAPHFRKDWHKWVQAVVEIGGGLQPWMFAQGCPFQRETIKAVQIALWANVNPYVYDIENITFKGWNPNVPRWGEKSPHFPPKPDDPFSGKTNYPFLGPGFPG